MITKSKLKKMLKEKTQEEVRKKLKLTYYELQILKNKFDLVKHRSNKVFFQISDEKFKQDYFKYMMKELSKKYGVVDSTILARAKRLGIYFNRRLKKKIEEQING